MMKTKTALYLRVSTASKSQYGEHEAYDQNPDVQKEPLLTMAAQRGWEVVRTYCDRMTGSRWDRPELDRLLSDARRHRFQVVMIFRFDRLGRSTKEFLQVVDELHTLGVDLVAWEQALETSTAMGRFVLTMFAALAELERNVIRQRIQVGIEHAKKHGTKSGRALGRPRIVFDREAVLRLRQSGLSIASIVRETGLSTGTVYRALQSDRDRALQKPPGQAPAEALQSRRLA